jgi:DNA adenine methylase
MNFKPRLKPPITYYGGKQQMLQHILPNIPQHDIYTEAFFGGGAVFFAKEPCQVEVVNDLNGEVINFYQVLQMDFWKLNDMIQATLHSRDMYRDAQVVYDSPHLFEPIRRAWAFWILTNQGFSSKIGSWGYDNQGDSMVKRLASKKTDFTIAYRNRLERVQIECNDALKVIKSRDSKRTFHYIDPPYIGSDQGHYSGYTEENYTGLMDCMTAMEGKFLQSSYWSEILAHYVKKHGWCVRTFEKPVSADKLKKKKKVEVLVANYELV